MTENNVGLSQEITHIGTDHITLTFGGNATHNSCSVTKSFNVAKADLGDPEYIMFPWEPVEANTDVTIRFFLRDYAGYNAFEIDDFTMILYIGEELYYENGAVRVFSSDKTLGYAELTFNIGQGGAIELVTHDSTHYNQTRVTLPEVTVVSMIKYGLGTSNPWTTNNTQNAIFNSNQQGWLITNYKKQSTGTLINIPLIGDFELTVNLNVMSTEGMQGTAIFGLHDTQNDVLKVASSPSINSVNGENINTVFPNCEYYGATEQFVFKRSGITYTYQHGDESKTFTINNTNNLYFKMTKTGGADMAISTISIIGGGQ